MKRLLIASVLSFCLICTTIPLGGCNAVADGQRAQAVIGAVIAVAQAETPLLPAQDQAAYTSAWAGVQVLDTALGTCLTNITGVMPKGAKVAACFSAFATSFSNPSVLAQFRIISPATQKKVQLYIAGISAAIQIIVAFTTPTVAPPPSSQEMHNLGIRAGLTERELIAYGY